jgi:hypothetical protein
MKIYYHNKLQDAYENSTNFLAIFYVRTITMFGNADGRKLIV